MVDSRTSPLRLCRLSPRLAPALVMPDKTIEIAVEHGAGVADLIASAQVLMRDWSST